MSWREESLRIIDERYRSIKEAQPTLTDIKILKMVSLHYYPFGQREYHPYKQWLAAMREYKAKLTNEIQGISGPLFEDERRAQ